MSQDNRQLVTFKVEEETYEIAKSKLDHGQMSEELRTALNRIAYGTKTTKREQLREELETLRSDKRDLDKEIDELRQERSEKERKIERVEDKLDTLRDIESEYNGALEMLESRLHEGERIYPEDDGVERAAIVDDKSKSDVIADLKQRNPDVPGFAFSVASPHEATNWQNVEDGR